MKNLYCTSGVLTVAVYMLYIPQASAQATSEASDVNDIIVTARKRDETSLSVPVVITAVSGAQLESQGINTIDGLSHLVPQMISGEGGGAQQGIVSIRGLSGSESNPLADQAVSFNIDGVQVARSNIRRMAEMDIAQVEILKGPQALFFGKNSPAGVISVRSADPTYRFEVKATLGYEVEAREVRGEAYVSGPLTPDLGARLAVYGSDIHGFGRNLIDRNSVYAPSNLNSGAAEEFAVRGTLKYDPGGRFDATLKLSYGDLSTNGPFDNSQFIDCPSGRPQTGDNIACKRDKFTIHGANGPLAGTIDPKFGNGDLGLSQKQELYGLTMNYDLTDDVQITSVTGYYNMKSNFQDNVNPTANPAFIIATAVDLNMRERSQEIRIGSSFDGPFNFLVGAHISDSRILSYTHSLLGTTTFVRWNVLQKGTAYSAFGQVSLKPIDTLELTAGGRYSTEHKRLPVAQSGVALLNRNLVAGKESWNNFSPEVSVTYRPTDRLTLFTSYKKGFLSGGFNAPTVNANADVRYDQQTIAGFEGGVKALLLDGNLRLDLTGYSYNLKGLQVSTSINGVLVTTNAGAVSIDGGEISFDYRTPLVGLKLHGTASLAKGRFDRFTVACFRGQTQAQGCNFGTPAANGNYSLQDRSGDRLTRAPQTTFSLGAVYETDLSGDLKLGLSSDVSYNSSYDTDASGNPAGRQDGFALFDASLRLGNSDKGWEAAIVGRNLANTYYAVRTTAVTLTGTAAGGLTGSRADTQGYLNRGREVLFRVSYKFGG